MKGKNWYPSKSYDSGYPPQGSGWSNVERKRDLEFLTRWKTIASQMPVLHSPGRMRSTERPEKLRLVSNLKDLFENIDISFFGV
jgi:hypothetical protein